MCGIAGILYHDPSRACETQRLRAMRDVMTHRGPDDAGTYLDGPLGLAHRRLSIIDLGSGHQPMMSADEDLCVVFNGEIYNYRELRRELEARGHAFRTQSDTEVLLYGYREWGEHCPEHLNGIFAFALWDKRKQQLFLARDHMGIKPLYYARTRDALVFASEIKALFDSGHLSPEVALDRVPEYLAFGYVAGERTLFRDVACLLPGHSMTIDGGQARARQYWSPLQSANVGDRSDDEALEQLAALVESAVRLQMVSDVPLGTFCSGGIDSSLVTAICARNSGAAINTYSVGFHETEWDETMYARMVSSRYGTDHHELRVDNRQFAELLPRMVWHNDEPLNFANSVHIYALSRLSRDRVKVVLTGEGADELFGGYPRYLIPTMTARFQRLPSALRRLVRIAARLSPERRIRKLAASLDAPLGDALLFNSGRHAPAAARQIWDIWHEPNYRTQLYARLDKNSSALQCASLIDQHTYLVSILYRQDKMSMAASIESRVPLLDYRLVEFANALPDRFKQSRLKTKVIWKRLAERYLPREVVHRRKSGFGVPLRSWFAAADGLGVLADAVFAEIRAPEIDEMLPVKQLISAHRAGRSDHSDLLWLALNYLLWKQAFRMA